MSQNILAEIAMPTSLYRGAQIRRLEALAIDSGIAGIELMTRAMARELASYDVNINSVAPGATKTPMNEPLRTLPEHKEVLDAFVSNTPSNTTFSDPVDIARMVVYLATDDARPMHGSSILMDEGVAAGI